MLVFTSCSQRVRMPISSDTLLNPVPSIVRIEQPHKTLRWIIGEVVFASFASRVPVFSNAADVFQLARRCQLPLAREWLAGRVQDCPTQRVLVAP